MSDRRFGNRWSALLVVAVSVWAAGPAPAWAIRAPSEPRTAASMAASEAEPPDALRRDLRDLPMLGVELAGAPTDERAVVVALKRHLDRRGGWLGGIRTAHLRLHHIATVPADDTHPATVYVQFVQQHEGLDVAGSYVHLTLALLKNLTRIVSAQATVYPALLVSAGARQAQARLRETAARALGLDPARATLTRERRHLRYLGGRWRKVQEIRFEESADKGVVDEATGESWVEEDRVYLESRVRGRGVLFDPPATGPDLPTLTLKDLRVTTADTSGFTDADGRVVLDTASDQVNATLQGRWTQVTSATSPDLSLTETAVPGQVIELLFNPVGAEEPATAQVNGYYHTSAIHDWIQVRLPAPLPGIDTPLPTKVNLGDTCNAYYDYASINFFKAGGGCINTAYDTVVYHEYGHFVDDTIGGITNGGLSEGWGDVLAVFSTNQPLIGEGFFGPGTKIRTANNAYQYPPSGQDEVHALGQAWAGFAWHLRQNLVTSLGPVEGVAVAERLVIPTLVANSVDIPTAVRDVLLLDDTDGDMANGTPHEAQIRAAAAQHSIPIPEPDIVPPAPVNDLAAVAAGLGRATLTWTATGDDGLRGTAASYDIRYATQPILTDADFAGASRVANPPTPKRSGGAERMTATGLLPGTTVSFAMKVLDNMGNASPLSNPAQAALAPGTVIFTTNFESGAPGWTSAGLWHLSQARSSSPATSAAYNDGVDYDTGVPNSGTLTSPAISLAGPTAALLVFSHWFQTELYKYGAYDIRRVQVSKDAGATWTTLKQWDSRDPNQLFWAPAGVELSAYLGKTIRIRFVFDTVDRGANRYEGWYVDDVAVIGGYPDLTLAALSTAQTAVVPGAKVTLSNTVTNQGEGGAGAFVIAFHLSQDAVYGGADDLAFSTTRSLSSLAIGVSSSANTTLTVPLTTPLGRYYLCALADSGGKVSEGVETNNSRCTAAPIQVTRPDLLMTAVSGPATGTRGKAISVASTVRNAGAIDAGSSYVGLYLSQDAVITTSDTYLGRYSLTLAAGATRSASTAVGIPSTLTPGPYYLGAITDYANQVTEADETNNALPGTPITVK